MSKQYSVRALVKNTKADKLAVRMIHLNNNGCRMTDRQARELLARRRFIALIKEAGRE